MGFFCVVFVPVSSELETLVRKQERKGFIEGKKKQTNHAFDPNFIDSLLQGGIP